jgi:hypothetical protein
LMCGGTWREGRAVWVGSRGSGQVGSLRLALF